MSRRNDALYGINSNEIARICGVDLATARRWKRGATCPPQTAVMILQADLGCFSAEWSGWTIAHGKLTSPEGWEATPGEILAIPLMRLQIQNYQLDQRLAKAQLEALEEQPLPETRALPKSL